MNVLRHTVKFGKVAGLGLLWLVLSGSTVFAEELCGICSEPAKGTMFRRADQITGAMVRYCRSCSDRTTVCYLCGLPAVRDYQSLTDGRILCVRDARTAVLDDAEAAKLCEQVKADLDRQFSRFITFPETNVALGLIDRVNLQELYQVIGNDYSCPFTLGLTWTRTNQHGLNFRIGLLSGLPRQTLQTTCVHEYTHTWLRENLSPTREAQVGKDAVEGFCELVAYLFAEAQQLESGRTNILSNHYTRGQIQLFIAAERQFGFNEIVEWMKYGEDDLLIPNELGRARRLNQPAAPAPTPIFVASGAPKAFTGLVLQGITWSKTRPMAMINDRTFEARDELPVRLGGTNVNVRCVAITQDTVTVQMAGTEAPQMLRLKAR